MTQDPRTFTRICETLALGALVQTREIKEPDSVAAVALVRAGLELMRMDGHTPDELAEWLRRQADAVQAAGALGGPHLGTA